MKLLAFSDVHGCFDEVTLALRSTPEVDALIVAGDITQFGTPSDVDRAVAEWRPLTPVLMAVAGNIDSPEIERHLQDIGISLNACCRRLGQAAFFGCSAAPISLLRTPYEISEAEIAGRLRRAAAGMDASPWRVLVSHSPPRGVLDLTNTGVRAGSESVRTFIEREQPTLVICGHIHEALGQQRLGSTLVVNCGAGNRGHYAVIELDDKGCRATLF